MMHVCSFQTTLLDFNYEIISFVCLDGFVLEWSASSSSFLIYLCHVGDHETS